jgi:hypothetical protein
VANGKAELARHVWIRPAENGRKAGLVSFAEVAGDFHEEILLKWLLGLAEVNPRDGIAPFVLRHWLAGRLETLLESGLELALHS